MKKQRINLNLFFDHEPQEFLVHCDEFIVQISCKDIANVNLFLSELQYVFFPALFSAYLNTFSLRFFAGMKITPQLCIRATIKAVPVLLGRAKLIQSASNSVKYLIVILLYTESGCKMLVFY